MNREGGVAARVVIGMGTRARVLQRIRVGVRARVRVRVNVDLYTHTHTHTSHPHTHTSTHLSMPPLEMMYSNACTMAPPLHPLLPGV